MGNSSTTIDQSYTWTRDFPSKGDKLMKFSYKSKLEPSDLVIGDPYEIPISSTTDSVALVLEYTMGIQNISRTHLYWHSREESLKTSISKTLKSIQKHGWVKAEAWNNSLNYINHDPERNRLKSNKVNLKIRKIRVKDIKPAINEGYPVIFGFTVYNTELSYPKESDTLLGGLCGVIYGFDDDSFKVRTKNENKDFEERYITDEDLSFDFWIMYSEGKQTDTKKYTIVDDSSDEDEEL